jgi:hypothetical protein
MNGCLILTICLLAALGACESNRTPPQHKSIATQFAEDTQSELSPRAPSTSTIGHEESEKSDPLETAIALETGVFGIRFGTTTDEVMKS